jgi:isoleucyl-tRNA synthetase
MTEKNKQKKYYSDLDPKPNFAQLELNILEFWEEKKIFNKSVNDRSEENEYVFYDGPPFANGLPHYGHLLTGFVKDIIPRYQTMKGRRVERRFGWDCHGLPAEMETEKELGLNGRSGVINFGVKNFNDHCRESVMKYTQEWETTVNRQARWVDFDNDYKTLDLNYMESVIWAFKKLWDQDLIYEKAKVMPYSWKAETPLSNFETRLDDSYRERVDPAITVKFSLEEDSNLGKSIDILVWTTTPWTLPSNLALAVGEDISYSIFSNGKDSILIAENTVEKYKQELDGMKKIKTINGDLLVGMSYKPIFDYFSDTENSFKILAADFVNTEEGTGIVHMAPGFGEDDQIVCESHGIPIKSPVDSRGKFTSEIKDYEGMLVFDANEEIIKNLDSRKILFKHEEYSHRYPHSWRTDEPLIYKAVNSWFVEVTKFRDRMSELNQQINWIPNHIKDGAFGRWLSGARDWSISRNRFWGTPIPVWKSDNPEFPRIDVYGSLDEIEKDFGVRPSDLHRPAIDELTRPNPDDPSGKSMMVRVEEVLDCWFESGSMPFAQVHYPFENKAWFDSHFPADFIVEYIAQTRGWFYTLMVLSTALFDSHPFKNAIGHGVVVDETGSKLSKRLRNYPSPEEVWEKYGSDALRWFLVSSPILKGHNLEIDRKGSGIETAIRKVIVPIWNSLYFFVLYSNLEHIKAEEIRTSEVLIDQYILGKMRKLIVDVNEKMENYEITDACIQISDFIDVLNNWYIRRSRPRFWDNVKSPEVLSAYNTLYTVLKNFFKILAPFLPLISEFAFKKLSNEISVHLEDWPSEENFEEEDELIEKMDFVRQIVSVALSIRKINNLRVRQPVKSVTVISPDFDINSLNEYEDLIKEEINSKEIIYSKESFSLGGYQLKLNPRVLGPKLGHDVQKCIIAAREDKWEQDDKGKILIEGYILEEDEFTLEPVSNEDKGIQKISGFNVFIKLDLNITSDLKSEGFARDLVRLIQNIRRDTKLEVTDKVNVEIFCSKKLKESFLNHYEYISEQTLSHSLNIQEKIKSDDNLFTGKISGEEINLSVLKK